MKRATAAAFALTAATGLIVGIPATANAASGDRNAPAHQGAECEGKQNWPELVGTNAEKAKRTIEAENPRVTAVIISENALVTSDFRCDRVRVHTEAEDDRTTTVARTPRVG
ncbi:serine protease inhibitor [Allosalinactinospora lopnorensis]|uniref:serine protease inhibitor n=1 Tax=Allosalinactinospora lopnorensis TaxID=1352348 RepID=UPI000623E407|nr:serine protease inhibitor [Allosalinactinospora lopnorensis]